MGTEMEPAEIQFEEHRPGEFRLLAHQYPLVASFPMSRREAEDLMHQMVFVLGYKLEN